MFSFCWPPVAMAAPAPRPVAARWRERVAARRMREVVGSCLLAALRGLPATPPCARGPNARLCSASALRGVAAGASPASEARARRGARARRAAVTWRGPGRDDTRRASLGRGVTGVWAQISSVHWLGSRCGRGVCAVLGRSQPGADDWGEGLA